VIGVEMLIRVRVVWRLLGLKILHFVPIAVCLSVRGVLSVLMRLLHVRSVTVCPF